MSSSLETLEQRVGQLEDDRDRNRDAHEKIYARLDKLEKVQAVNTKLVEGIDEIKADVKELKEKPAKRWDNAVNSIIQWLIIAALALSNLFVK